MRLRYRIGMGMVLLTFLLLAVVAVGASAQESVVRAILFYSPSCGHCHHVMEEILPPLREQYGAQLQILEIDAATEAGSQFYQVSTELYEIPPEWQGVPRLLVGEKYLVGSQQIPEQFPVLIEKYLAAGGVDWPAIPDLPTEEFASVTACPTWQEKYMQDPVGSTLCVIVLAGLLAALGAVAKSQPWQARLAERVRPWGFLAVALVGFIAAVYLSYVETTQSSAICGPVGDCNAVQQSQFALLFGCVPMAIFGLLGYLAVFATFIYGYWGRGRYAEYAPLATFLLTVFGVLFSAGLTFLEPFVIGATCAWCLTSAVSMGLLLLFSAGPGWEVVTNNK
ncbi:MAG: vitamin K epoxide reductase family protein [Chloroflexota bacterium]|nr:vitamin K epoxide reductase family protein [Chloroflexota bacterium]